MTLEHRQEIIHRLDTGEEPSRERARILFPPEKREYELVDIFASAGLMRRRRGRLIFETVENFGSAPSWREIRMARLDDSGEALSL